MFCCRKPKPEMIASKHDLEIQLKDEHQLIQQGVLRDDNPLDDSDEFLKLCEACRIGDLKQCQEAIAAGVDLNARDRFDYTPLILASLCGHYEVVQLLLESGALCERDTFQGERCLYNALNNRIRNLLLQYDYSKSSDPLQPLASHISSLLTRQTPRTSDILLTASFEEWSLHKLILSARSPFFRKKLQATPSTKTWRLSPSIPTESFQIALRFLYMGEIGSDSGFGAKGFTSEDEILKGVDKISKQLEIDSLWEEILAGNDRRIARQRHQDELLRAQGQLETWFRENVLCKKINIATEQAANVKWTSQNEIFADILLQADEAQEVESAPTLSSNGIPLGESATSSSPRSVLYPAHRAMLLRSDYFQTMFTSGFMESTTEEHLHIVKLDCAPAVLEIVLCFLYTEKAEVPLDLAVDVIFAADMLFIEKLKNKAAIVLSTLGNGVGRLGDRTHAMTIEGDKTDDEEVINIYDVLHAAWITKVQRLEEFSARYIAYRLEDYIDEAEFEELVRESASRIQTRQATDTIELIDDIRYYLSERFRLRFEDSGFHDLLNENGELDESAVEMISTSSPLETAKSPSADSKPEEHSTTGDSSPSEASSAEAAQSSAPTSPGTSKGEESPLAREGQAGLVPGQIRTLDGKVAGDEFAADAVNYQVLLGKIDTLLESLQLDA